MRDVIDIYTEVAQKMQGISRDQKIAVTEGLAGKYHITRMQTFLDDLAQADSHYRSMLQSSKGSAGSSFRENEIYLQSLEARISKARVAVEKLALVLGEAILTPATVEGLEAFVEGLGAIGGLVSKVGALPIIFGTVSTAVLLLSKNTRELATSLAFTGSAMTATQVKTALMEGTMTRAAAATNLLKISLRGLLAASGVGLVIMGVGAALEFLLSKQAEARQATEQLESQQKVMLDSYSENEKGIQSLASEYEQLEEVINSGNYNDEQLTRFKEVRAELAKLMPSLVVGENSYGESLIGSAQRVQAQIDLAEQQLEIQKQVNAEKEKAAKLEAYEGSKKSYDKLLGKKDLFFDEMPANMGINNEDDLMSKYSSMAERASNGELNALQQDTFEFLERQKLEWDDLNNKILSAGATMSNATMEYVNTLMSADASTSNVVDSIVSDFGLLVATSGLTEDKMSSVFSDLVDSVQSGEMKQELQSLGVVMKEYDDAKKQYLEGKISTDELQNYATEANKQLKTIKASLLEIARQELGGGTSQAYSDFKNQLDTWIPSIEAVANTADKAADSQNNLKSTAEMSTQEIIDNALANTQNAGALSAEGQAAIDAASGMDASTASTDENTAAKYENMTAGEMMAGITQDNVDKTFQMIEVYNLLSSVEQLSTDQKYALGEATGYLAQMYPHLVNAKGLNIEAMQKEAEMNNVLIAASEASANGQLTAQESSTLGSALGTKARIEHIKSEILALQQLVAAWTGIEDLEQARGIANSGMGSWETRDKVNEAYNKIHGSEALGIDGYMAELDALQGELGGYTATLIDIPAVQDKVASGSNRMAEGVKKAQEAAKEANKEAEKSAKANEKNTEAITKNTVAIETQITAYDMFTFTADRYTTAQNRLNTAMAKQQMILAKYPKHSDMYIKALKNELAINKALQGVNLQNRTSLKNQIATGNFITPGVNATSQIYGTKTTATYDSSTTGGSSSNSSGSTPSTTTAKQVAGVSNKSKTWNFFAQQGFSASAIAGIMGNLHVESAGTFDPKIKQYGGGPAKGLAQWEGDRWGRLTKWAKQNGKDPYALQTQLEYIMLELQGGAGTEKTTSNLLKKLGGVDALKKMSVSEAMKAFGKTFERPGKPHWDARQKHANTYYNQFGSGSTSAASYNVTGGTTKAASNNVAVSTPKTTTSTSATGSLGKATGIVAYGQKFVGKLPYVFGGESLVSGADCSYFVQQVILKTTGYKLPRTAAQQQKHGTAISKNQIQAGDLVFFANTGDRKGVTHVGIAIGGGKMVNAQSKKAGTTIVDFVNNSYWSKHYHSAKRLNYSSSKNPDTGITYTGNVSGGGGGVTIDENGNKTGTVTLSDTNASAQAQSDASKLQADRLAAAEAGQNELYNLTTEAYQLDEEEEALRHEIIMSPVYKSQHAMEQKDTAVQKYKNETYWLEKTSQAYRENLLNQRKQLLSKQSLITAEEKEIRKLLNGGVQMSETTREELQKRLDELNNLKVEVAEARDAIQYEIITSTMAEYQKSIDKVTRSIDRLRTARNYLEKDSRQYRDSLKEEAKLLMETNHEIMNQINTMQRQSYYYKMTPEQVEEFKNSLEDLQDQLIANGNTIEDLQRELADSIIDTAKQAYEQRRDLETKAIEERLEKEEKAFEESLEKEEKAFEEKWEMYEKDAEEYEKSIQRKIDALQSQYDEDQYLKGLNKLKDEEQKILKQINILSLDDSQDAKARRIDLEEQLKDVREQIEDETSQHSLDTQVEKLEDELEVYNEKLEKEREAEEKALEEKRELAEKEIEEKRELAEEEIKQINWKYQEILNDEKMWNEMRMDILEGNTTQMQFHLNSLISGMKNYSTEALKELEISAKGMESLLNNLRDAGQDLGLIGDLEDIGDNTNTNDIDNFVEKNAAWNKYLSNKRKYDRPETTAEERKALAAENATLRKQWGFVDGHYSDLEKLDINNTTTQQTNGSAMNARLKAWAEYIKNKEDYQKAPDTKTQQALIKRNAELRAQYNFPDAPLNVLKQIDSDHIADSTDPNMAKKVQDWYTYLQNKRDYVQAKDTKTQLALQKENAALRSKWKFPDGTLEHLLTLDPTKFHSGGIVGSKPNRLGEIFNKIFNAKPGEQVIKSLVGELQVPPKNFANGIANLREVAANLIQPVPVATGGAGSIEINFNVDTMYGTEQEARSFSSKIIDTMKRNGRY